jgi:hypothetical protein
MTTTNIPNPYLKKLSMKELRSICESVLKSRQEQFLGHMGMINLDNFLIEEDINIRENFTFEISKNIGLNDRAVAIIKKFPFDSLLNKIKKNDWNKNTEQNKSTFFNEFMKQLKENSTLKDSEYDLVLRSIVSALAENPYFFTKSYIEETALKEIPVNFFRETTQEVTIEQASAFPKIVPLKRSVSMPARQRSVSFSGVNYSVMNSAELYEEVKKNPTLKRLKKVGVVQKLKMFKKREILYLIRRDRPDTEILEAIVFANVPELNEAEAEMNLRRQALETTRQTSPAEEEKSEPEELLEATVGLGMKRGRGRPRKNKRGGNMIPLNTVKDYAKMNAKQLTNELALLIGSKMAGNTGVANDINSLLKHMKKVKIISPAEFKKFLKL